MGFETLPGSNIQYPIQHFAPIPARPVIPTAAYAAHIAQSIGEIMKSLSPEERRRKQLQLQLIGATLREHNARAEFEETRAQAIKHKQQQDQQEIDRLTSKLPKTTAIDNSDLPDNIFDSPQHDVPTTEPADYWA